MPSSASFLRKRAGQRVAPAIACIGVAPRRTQVSSSRQVESVWKFIGMPLSVPTSIVTPVSRSCLNLFASVGMRRKVSVK